MRNCMDTISRAGVAVKAGVVALMACVGLQSLLVQDDASMVWGVGHGRVPVLRLWRMLSWTGPSHACVSARTEQLQSQG